MARRETGRTRPYNYQLLINHWLGAGLLILRLGGDKLAEPAPTIINY
ncbi:hypothetical protein [Limnospira fusiformis]|nr:hypothetical protein HFV01_15550 [Limnospira fusiformis SAG 85.79]